MDKIDDLRTELKAMEKIAKILHELPSPEALLRVADWIQEVARPERWSKAKASATRTETTDVTGQIPSPEKSNEDAVKVADPAT